MRKYKILKFKEYLNESLKAGSLEAGFFVAIPDDGYAMPKFIESTDMVAPE